MSFQNLTNSIDKFIKFKPWLQWVGLALSLLALAFIPTSDHFSMGVKLVAVVGDLVSATGFVYDLIYP